MQKGENKNLHSRWYQIELESIHFIYYAYNIVLDKITRTSIQIIKPFVTHADFSPIWITRI